MISKRQISPGEKFQGYFLHIFTILFSLGLHFPIFAEVYYSPEQFSNLIHSYSEAGAKFPGENIISNEPYYLSVVPELEKVQATKGIYIGVGPEQNFSYIIHSKPDVAYLIDIRRENQLLLLLYKAIFEASPNRLQFLSMLFARENSVQSADATTVSTSNVSLSVNKLLEQFEQLQLSPQLFSKYQTQLISKVCDTYLKDCTPTDKKYLSHAYQTFFDQQLDIRYDQTKNALMRDYPTFKDLMLAKNNESQQYGHFLSTENSYQTLRTLQIENRIIPLVADVSGTKTLKLIGEQLKKNNEFLKCFYISNVEEVFLHPPFHHFNQYVENLDSLPKTKNAVLIRSYRPFKRDKNISPMKIQLESKALPLTEFINDAKEGRYRSRIDLMRP